MITLLKLEFENIGRFVEKQTISFSDKAKIIQLDGFNQNTGGSSGAGKSTVFHSLDLLLGLNDLPASSLQSRLTKEGFRVSGEFLIDGNSVTITRSKKDGLVINTKDGVFEGSNKLAEEKLDELIKIPRKIFKKMIHKQQKAGGFFLGLSSKESYQFLIECLGLKEWDEKVGKITEDIKKSEETLLSIASSIESDRSHLSSLQTTMESISIPEFVDTDALLKEIETSKELLSKCQDSVRVLREKSEEEAQKTHKLYLASIPQKPVANEDSILGKLKEELNAFSRAEQEVMSRLLSSKTELQEKVSKITHLLSQANSEASQLDYLNAQISKKSSFLNELLSHNCPTCKQAWDDNGAIVEEHQKVQAEVSSLQDQVSNINLKIANIPRLQAILDNYKTDLYKVEGQERIQSQEYANKKSMINSEIANIHKQISQQGLEWSNAVKENELKYGQLKFEIEQKYLKLAENPRSEMLKLQKNIEIMTNSINLYKNSVLNYQNLTKNTKNQMETLQNSIRDNEKQLKTIEKHIKIAEESRRAIKNYNLQIFQDTLNFVGNYATKILNAVPAMANATLYFENYKETKTGKIKDEVNCVINIDGENDININTLSGGERTAVDLAVDLAVVEVLESHLGIGSSWIVLDEPFEGMDVAGIEAAMDVIRQIDLSKQVIIVDHHTEVKELVGETITVVRSGTESALFGGI
jgi:DNA repair exonuclease SbcCD ATPase subunit